MAPVRGRCGPRCLHLALTCSGRPVPCAAGGGCRTPRESSLAAGRALDRRQEMMDSRPWRQLGREEGNRSCCQGKAVPRSPRLPREVEQPPPQAVGSLGAEVTRSCPGEAVGVRLPFQGPFAVRKE